MMQIDLEGGIWKIVQRGNRPYTGLPAGQCDSLADEGAVGWGVKWVFWKDVRLVFQWA